MITEVVLPNVELTSDEMTILTWIRQEGDAVKKGDVLLEVEADKVVLEVESPAEGILRKVLSGEGDVVLTGTVVALVGDLTDPLPQIEEAPEGREPGAAVPLPVGLADESALTQALDVAEEGAEEATAPISRTRQVISTRVRTAWQTIPHYYLMVTIDLSSIHTERERLDQAPTYTDFFLFCLSRALVRFPALNSHWHDEGVKTFSSVHIVLLVDTEDGLIAPVIRGAEQKSLVEIASARALLVERAKTKRLLAQDLSEATFTLSNIGAGVIESFTSIIYPPQVAIFSVGSIGLAPKVVEGQILVRPSVICTLGADHRAVDGRMAASFLKHLKAAMEGPWNQR